MVTPPTFGDVSGTFHQSMFDRAILDLKHATGGQIPGAMRTVQDPGARQAIEAINGALRTMTSMLENQVVITDRAKSNGLWA